MQYFFPLKTVIQEYPWGSYSSLNDLFDIPNPNNMPQAEVWMGAHLNGCSTITHNGVEISLKSFIDSDIDSILGAQTSHLFGELPFLFKILCAEQALSVQVHPNKSQAEDGFQKEHTAGIAITDSTRNYKDPNHKPELVFALTPYQAMNGFREFADILALFHQLNIDELSQVINQFEINLTESGLCQLFETLLSLNGNLKTICVEKLIAYAEQHSSDALFSLILNLAKQYPGDMGLFSPLLLNTITLAPGEAMFLDACTPHAYIKGSALEIMANSDNVLRAGLTQKHMDVSELISCLRCTPLRSDELLITPLAHGNAKHYDVPVRDFCFSVYTTTQNEPVQTNSAEILLAIDAPLTISHVNGETRTFEKGESVFIPAYAESYSASCQGAFARAYNSEHSI